MATKKKLTSIDEKLCEVVQEAYRKCFTVQSDYARSNAAHIAMAASIGLISTKLAFNVFSSDWRPTCKGLQYLEDTAGIHLDDDGTLDEGHD